MVYQEVGLRGNICLMHDYGTFKTKILETLAEMIYRDIRAHET